MKRTVLSVLVLLLLIFNLPAQNKTALIIANEEYSHFSRLSHPVGESRQMSNALKRLGFEVILLLNGSEDQMIDALVDFEYKLKERGGLAFFLYCGHGVQVDGENYLIPVDADIPDERRVRSRAVEVDEVVGTMEASGSTTNIIILDACRDNPLPSDSRSGVRGLAVMSRTPPNTIVVYSAAAGATAQDGLFTPTLLNYLEKPMEFTDILQEVRRDVRIASGNRQRPGEYNQLEEDIYLSGRGGGVTTTEEDFIVEAPPPVGNIRVSLEETGIVYLDGEEKGEVPGGGAAILSDISIGSHTVEIRYDGHSEERSVNVTEGGTSRVSFTWEAPVYGTIRVTAATAGSFYMDGRYKRRISAGATVSITEVPEGRRSLEMRYGDERESKTVPVSENRTVTAAFTWIEAPPEPEVPEDFVFVDGGTFQMGSTSWDSY